VCIFWFLSHTTLKVNSGTVSPRIGLSRWHSAPNAITQSYLNPLLMLLVYQQLFLIHNYTQLDSLTN